MNCASTGNLIFIVILHFLDEIFIFLEIYDWVDFVGSITEILIKNSVCLGTEIGPVWVIWIKINRTNA